MSEVDVKQALKDLTAVAKLTQTEIGEALKCTQANVHYHMHSTAKKSRAPALLVERLIALLKKHQIAVPMAQPAVGGI